ncbi:MAG TPA: DnaJ C-terminal domain-containing protein [Opitutales bacterium]|nr:DnaJ C-terminal domain-containing protein [Opitutales bacterium]
MAIKYKDYYQILNVSRTASQEEIKQAYRKLARKYHPDVSGGAKGAEEKFKEVNEAYEVLKDPEKRRKYDSFGSGMEHDGNFRPPEGWQQQWGWQSGGGAGEDFDFNFEGTGFSDFFEAFFGSRGTAGRGPFGGTVHRGFSERGARQGRDLEADIMVTLEEAIHGSTRQVSVQRGDKAGGVETYQVKIPPGVRQGQRIRLAQKGEPGSGGARPGHLYLRVRLSEHPHFRVEGHDIYYDLLLAPWEAVLGARVEVPTPDGNAALKIPEGTVSGKTFRFRQKGLPQPGGVRGHMYAVVRIQVPKKVSAEERKLWEELSRISDFHPRRG